MLPNNLHGGARGLQARDFFLGLMDFFTILLPGALLAYLAEDLASQCVFGKLLPRIQPGVEGWVTFLLASYLFGQFLFLIGATFMDSIYDKTYLRVRRKGGDRLYEKAKELAGGQGEYAGVRKWATTMIRLHSSDASLQIDRLEATSKFFRSVFVVLIVYFFTFAFLQHWLATFVVAVMLGLSFWRFAEQRWKLTELTYLFYLQLSAMRAQESQTARACFDQPQA
jgi:hypothetical protein